MRIVQSFWSCNRSLTEEGFGWLSPQYHLMAWTLSCLNLKKHYDDLHLYTDSNGIAILIDYLNLPYKSVQPCYDQINHYNKKLWALPKILTYAAQNKPFIHVDGDVFIWDRFKPHLETAPLVAQNLEEGTVYYKTLMDNVRKNISHIPDFLDNELNKESIFSYNAGLFGGNDIDFIKKYCNTALNLINNNYPNGCKNEVSVNFNILFEQILFYSISNLEKKEVTCFYKETFKDNGYSFNEFCDFTAVPNRLKYIHLIGGKKRDKEVCTLMSRVLLKQYPEYFYKIVALFKNDHLHFEKKIKPISDSYFVDNLPAINNIKPNNKSRPYYRTEQAIIANNPSLKLPLNEIKSIVENSQSQLIKETFEFETQLMTITNGWRAIPAKELYEIENYCNNHWGFYFKPKSELLEMILEVNHYLGIIEESFNWETEIKKCINPDLVNTIDTNLGLAFIPQLFFEGYNEIVIDELEYNILAILQESMPFKSMLSHLSVFFISTDNNGDAIYELALKKIKKLVFKRCIFIKNNQQH